MKNKKSFELSFSMLFAIIVGGVILFIAIYSATQFVKTGEKVIETENAQDFFSLLKPLEAGISSGSSEQIKFKQNTRIYLKCNPSGEFGKEGISISQILRNKWSKVGERVSFVNQYIFGKNIIEGKKFYVFSMPFNMPFKVADLVFVSSKKYCFCGAGEEIKNDVLGSGVENVIFSDKCNSCDGEYIKVCFNNFVGCGSYDIGVSEVSNYVYKNGKHLYYVDNLLYGAIFSSPEIYECNVKRLMKKLSHVIDLYYGKMNNLGIINMNPYFLDLNTSASSIINNGKLNDLISLKSYAENLNRLNDQLMYGAY